MEKSSAGARETKRKQNLKHLTEQTTCVGLTKKRILRVYVHSLEDITKFQLKVGQKQVHNKLR